MKTESEKTPFRQVSKNTGTRTASLNGKPFTQEACESAGMSDEEAQLKADEDALQQRKDKLAEQRKSEQAEARNGLLLQRERARTTAANYRSQAQQSTDAAEKRELYQWAAEADDEARLLEVELGMTTDEPVKEARGIVSFFQRNLRTLAIVQVAAVVLGILYFGGGFEMMGENMLAANRGLPMDKQLQPYDATSIQKLFFEKMVVFVDLPLALLILWVVAPFVAFYVLPIFRSKKDFYTEFFDELTAWQRAKISTGFMLGLLLFLALSHLVKP